MSGRSWILAWASGREGVRKVARLGAVGGALVVVLASGAGACSSNSAAPAPARETPCVLNSDCDPGLICSIGLLCRVQCKTSADCGDGGSCVTDELGHAVCRVPAENNVACDVDTDCPAPLACAADYRCRNRCVSDADCNSAGISGRICALDANGAHYCADPPEVNGQNVIDKPPPTLRDGGKLVAPAPPVDGSVPADGSVPMEAATPAEAGPDATTTMQPEAGGMDSGPKDAGVEAAVDAGGGGDAAVVGFPFVPSNFDPTAAAIDGGTVAIDWSHAPAAVDTTLPTPVTLMTSSGPLADLYVVSSYTVDSNTTVTLTNARPVIIAALTTVNIQGALVATPGKVGGAAGGMSPGTGAGVPAQTGGYANSAASGGSFCGVGGMGGVTVAGALHTPGGQTYGFPTVVPLVGGSAGGVGLYNPTPCGSSAGGGGAIQIVAGGSITIGLLGSIDVGGAGGQLSTTNSCTGSAGASGGAILLEAPVVTVTGALGANGGGGGSASAAGAAGTANAQPALGGTSGGGAGSAGPNVNGVDGADINVDGGTARTANGGGGGAGFIRINTTSMNAAVDAGVVSPDFTTGCASQGTITPLP